MTDISGSNTVSDGSNGYYTPTTEEVLKSWLHAGEPSVEFHRWLAEVKADAWQDGAYHIAGRDNELVTKADTENPYREGEGSGNDASQSLVESGNLLNGEEQ